MACAIVSFPVILSESLSYFIPGSKSILIVSGSPFDNVSFSVAQLNGGSILKVTVVGKGPELAKLNVFVIGIDATPFSQRYLKNSFGSLKFRLGFINLPTILVLKATLGFLSPAIVH